MTYLEENKVIKEAMMQAEGQLKDCFLRADYNQEGEKLLSNAVKTIREEFITRLAMLWQDDETVTAQPSLHPLGPLKIQTVLIPGVKAA
jgi:hypothetical protein